MAVGDIIQLTVDGTNRTVNLGRGMVIGNCTTHSNPQWGECQVYFTGIRVSQDTSTGRRIMIPSAEGTGYFLFLANSIVVYGFENVVIRSTNVFGSWIASDGRLQQCQPSAEERASSRRLLESSLNHGTFMCSFREARHTFSTIISGL